MTEDQHRQPQSPPKERKSIHDIRNQDLVSRFLAATPPYLYSAPVGPNNFFFSDMLRSLVQARNNENARNLQIQQATLGRRPRKRPWSSHRPYYEHLKERKELGNEEKSLSTPLSQPQPPADKPLELTNKQLFPISSKYAKTDQHRNEITDKITPKVNHHNNNGELKMSAEFDANIQNEPPAMQEPPAASLPPSDLVLPPPPPVWYPSMYPPYGIDPLHFFIDLRVSGHIYDRKKDNHSPGANADNNNGTTVENEAIGKPRHGSAFTVPPPRMDLTKTNPAAIVNHPVDLEKINNGYKYYDLSSDAKENQLNSKNTNYVLQNLPRIYMGSKDSDNEADNKSEADMDDLTEDTMDKENSNHIDVEIVENIRSRSIETASSKSLGDDQLGGGEIHQID